MGVLENCCLQVTQFVSELESLQKISLPSYWIQAVRDDLATSKVQIYFGKV